MDRPTQKALATVTGQLRAITAVALLSRPRFQVDCESLPDPLPQTLCLRG